MDRGGWVERDGERRGLSGNAEDGLALLRLLFPSMPEPVAVSHAVEVEELTWADRDRGSSVWGVQVVDDSPEDEDIRELEDALKQLWRWEPGGELTVTVGSGDEVKPQSESSGYPFTGYAQAVFLDRFYPYRLTPRGVPSGVPSGGTPCDKQRQHGTTDRCNFSCFPMVLWPRMALTRWKP